MNLRELTIDDVKIRLIVEPDDTPVRGNALASGDDRVDRAAENEILARLEAGDTWAWALVRVTVSWQNLSGYDTLGCCNYRDETDFRDSGTYDDMVACALDDLNNAIEGLAADLATLEEKAQ